MTDTPSVARMYDYFLGGTAHRLVDREAADAFAAANPGVPVAARANRAFLRHAVERMLSLGVRQFLDLGAGVPAAGNVHEIAQAVDPGARVAYVDHDPVVGEVGAEVLDGVAHTSVTVADVRDADAVLAAPGVADLIDFTRPVGLLLITVLHFVEGQERARELVAAYRRRLAPGSVVAITHVGRGIVADAAEEAGDDIGFTVASRSDAEILELLGDLVPDADGLVDVMRWSPDGPREALGIRGVVTEPAR